jgi:hypothetical protein
MKELFDETILDGRSFDELREALDFVLERIGKIEEELSDDEDDLRLDRLYTVADIIIKRMDSLIRECARESPGNFAQWSEVMRDYEVHYDKYTDAILEDDILLDSESPENS